MNEEKQDVALTVSNLSIAYGSYVVQRNLNFTINQGEIFVIMGGSGCGKSSLLRHLIGLKKPAEGTVKFGDQDLWQCGERERAEIIRKCGVMYQQGALWTSMSLLENIALPLKEYSSFSQAEIRDIASLKLALVGLNGFENFYPAEISGGMKKRAALARALAFDPEFLFIDEPSAGLDPLSAKKLDELLVTLSESLNTTIVLVTHELESLLAIGTDSVFLDNKSKTMLATGKPRELLENSQDERIVSFLSRGTR